MQAIIFSSYDMGNEADYGYQGYEDWFMQHIMLQEVARKAGLKIAKILNIYLLM